MNKLNALRTYISYYLGKKSTGSDISAYRLLSCFLLAFLLFCWTYKLSYFPGLHGDEAWSGLKAYYYLFVGVDTIHGMNTYTGILQPLSNFVCFKLFGINVLSLRICGIFFNFIGLIILLITLWKVEKSSVISFLLIMLQSALLISAPRIAWEVNTFTLFFISIMVASVFRVAKYPRQNNKVALWLFLIVSLLGSYNHILFSCISLAGTTALIFLSIINKELAYKRMLFLSLSSVFNQLLLFTGMHYFSEEHAFGIIVIPFFLLIIYLQTTLILKLDSDKINFCYPGAKFIKYLFIIASGTSFFIFHGHAFFEVLIGYKLIAYIYAIDTEYLPMAMLSVCGCLMTVGIVYFFYMDIIKSGYYSALAYVIVAYVALLPLYTKSTSFRYYIALYILISIYLSCQISKNCRRRILFWPLLCVSGIMLNVSIFKSFDLDRTHLAAIEIPVGQGQKEQSAHFYPKTPIIDFLRKNRIGRINYPKERYFIEQPILFYHLIDPWQAFPSRQGKIEFDPTGNNKGFKLIYEP